MEEKLYGIYEYIRDESKIISSVSNTKKIILKLMINDNEIIEYCNTKALEERQEVEEAKIGKHFHKGMSKREILVNEISQYMYWLIIMDVSRKIKYEDTKVFKKIEEIIDFIDISKIEECQNITIGEIINHDLDNMSQKEYLKYVIKNN